MRFFVYFEDDASLCNSSSKQTSQIKTKHLPKDWINIQISSCTCFNKNNLFYSHAAAFNRCIALWENALHKLCLSKNS